MSKNSPKQNLEALTEWMAVKKTRKVNTIKKEKPTRFEIYKQKGLGISL